MAATAAAIIIVIIEITSGIIPKSNVMSRRRLVTQKSLSNDRALEPLNVSERETKINLNFI